MITYYLILAATIIFVGYGMFYIRYVFKAAKQEHAMALKVLDQVAIEHNRIVKAYESIKEERQINSMLYSSIMTKHEQYGKAILAVQMGDTDAALDILKQKDKPH